MSMGTDERAALAAELAVAGRSVTVTRTVPGSYDPSTGTTAGGTSTDYAGRGRIGDYSDKVRDGTLIQQNDRMVTWQPTDASFVPQEGDAVSDGTNTYKVVSFKTRELEGDWICYTLQVRS